MRYPKIIDELNDSVATVVQLVLLIPNSIDFVKEYDKIGLLYWDFIKYIKMTKLRKIRIVLNMVQVYNACIKEGLSV